MRATFGVLILFLFIGLGIGFDHLIVIVDWPSFQIITACVVASFLICFDLKTIRRSFNGMITGKFQTEFEKKKSVQVAQLGAIISVLSSILTAVIGFILTAGYAETMSFEAQGPNLAVAVIPLVYGMMAGILFTCGMFRANRVEAEPLSKVFE